jgi:hypothetical protein
VDQFVAERYLASVDGERLHDDLARIRDAAEHVSGVSFLGSVYLPADDLCLYLFTSESADGVAGVAQLASVAVDRIRPAEVAR